MKRANREDVLSPSIKILYNIYCFILFCVILFHLYDIIYLSTHKACVETSIESDVSPPDPSPP